MDPAAGVRDPAPLDAGEGVVQVLGHGADLVIVDGEDLVVHHQVADGGDHGGGAAAPGFLQRAAAAGVLQLFRAEEPLADFVALVLQKLDAALAGDAGEDGAGEGGGHDLVADLEHDVHGAHFLDVLALHAVQPQDLGVALFLGLLARPEAGAVVAAALGIAGAAADGADVLRLDHDADGLQALLIIAAHGAGDDEELRRLDGVDPQEGVVAEEEGPQIEAGAGSGGDPALVDAHQGLQGFHKELLVDLGQAHAFRGIVHPADVLLRAEELHAPVVPAIGFQALEDLRAVVEHGGGRMEAQVAEGHDPGILPLSVLIFHHEHVVGKDLAEAQLVGAHLFLGSVGLHDTDSHFVLLLILGSCSPSAGPAC